MSLTSKHKEEILKEMENNGTINMMKAKVKSQVIEHMKMQKKEVKRKLDFELLTPFQKIPKGKELMLLSHLIIEFLQFYEMEYTAPIFLAETNINEKVKKETLLKDVNLRSEYDESQPILLQLLTSYMNDKPKSVNRIFDDPFYKKDKEVPYSGLGLLSGGLSSFNKSDGNNNYVNYENKSDFSLSTSNGTGNVIF